MPLRVPKQDLELHPRRQPHLETHRRPVRHRLQRRRPRHPIHRHQIAAVGALLVPLVELPHRVVGDGDGGAGVVVEEADADVGVVHAFVFHAVGQLQIEVYGVVAPGGGGAVAGVEGGDVELLDGAGGLGGAEAQPHEESGEAGGDYEAAAASAAPAAVVLRHASG